MGEVYRARDTRLGRDVAIKVLPSQFFGDPERLRRFEQEARAAGSLNPPNILTIFDIGSHDAAPYVVSELLEEETLRDRLAGSRLPQRKAIDYAQQVAQGLKLRTREESLIETSSRRISSSAATTGPKSSISVSES